MMDFMSQKALRDLESRCIQEEPPACRAACPLHVDARGVIGDIRRGNWDAAAARLRKRMPLAGILGRICDAPCRRHCRRAEVDAAIAIGALERACVSRTGPPGRVPVLPDRHRSVAVLGGGLAGMTAAWDLLRKGCRVSVFQPEAEAGGYFHALCDGRLSPAAIDAEVGIVTGLGLRWVTGVSEDDAGLLDHCLNDHDAAVVDLAVFPNPPWGLAAADGRVTTAPVTLSTSRDGVFAGGDGVSVVGQAAAGRWAAASADRYLQGVSLTAGREKDGPFETRLYTSLEAVTPCGAVAPADPAAGFTEAEAMDEARRCLQCECLACVKVCAYLEHHGAYPKKYAREIYNNAAIVMGERKANRLINACSLCGLCEAVCPERFPMPDLCLQARRVMVQREKMPPSAHEFALLDMAFSQGPRFAMHRHQPGCQGSRYLFFPGCQLCASAPAHVERLYAYLCDRLDGGVGLMLGCCSAPAFWAGREKSFSAALDQWRRDWEAMGRPETIAACATCFRMIVDHLPQVPVRSLWQVMDTAGLPAIKQDRSPLTLAVHDPCTARHEPEVRAAIRRLLARMNVRALELDLGGSLTECCGFGGLMQNAAPDIAGEVARRRAGRRPEDYVTYCAMCRDSLAAAGKPIIHILDLVFGAGRYRECAQRPRPGWSRRQENRERLRARLLAALWQEGGDAVEVHRRIRLRMADDVRERLERRRVLDEDIQRVIQHAEDSGIWWGHPETGRRRASFRPYRVTFWVEYDVPEKAGDAFVIHNAYSHRMEIIEGGPS